MRGCRTAPACIAARRPASYVAYDLEAQKETVLVEGLPNDSHAYYWLPDESGFIVAKTEKWNDPTDNFKRVLNLADRTGTITVTGDKFTVENFYNICYRHG